MAMINNWMPLLILFTSLFAAPAIFLLPEAHSATRTVINLAAALVKLALVVMLTIGVYLGVDYEIRFMVIEGVDFVLHADPVGVMFAGLSSLLWLFTTIYAVGYLEGSPNRSRFFGFFSICVTSTLGIALAGNLFTFILFYEMLTLSTYPLVVHRGTERAIAAGKRYLQYTLTGGLFLLLGGVALYALAGDITFSDHRQLADMSPDHHTSLKLIFMFLIAGLGVKTALVPLHGWLPLAMVAPAPVSALLHAVAVVKAGAFGVIRVVHDVYGMELCLALGVLGPVTIAASVTILYGSFRALTQTEIKRRLAFSTISQVSYIILGISLVHPLGVAAGLAHLIHQGLMKITLFFCAGNYAETLGIHEVAELNGIGRKMPVSSIAFTIGALGMIGTPPVAGFVTKWYLGMGAVGAGMYPIVLVLTISGLLNAAYFLPLVYRIWFCNRIDAWPCEQATGRLETSGWLLWPTVATAIFSLLAGIFAGLPFSPVRWANLIVSGGFLP